MNWRRNDVTALAVGWIALAVFVVTVCLLLPTPPDVPGAPQLTSVMLDFFFGAVAIAIVASVVSIAFTVSMVRGTRREVERRLDEMARLLQKRQAEEP